MAIGNWLGGLLGKQTTATQTAQYQQATQRYTYANNQFGSGATAWANIGLGSNSYAHLEQEDIKQLKRLLELKDSTPEQLDELAQSIAEHSGAKLSVVKSMLLVVKTLLELGDLQAKLEAEQEQQAQQVNQYRSYTSATTAPWIAPYNASYSITQEMLDDDTTI